MGTVVTLNLSFEEFTGRKFLAITFSTILAAAPLLFSMSVAEAQAGPFMPGPFMPVSKYAIKRVGIYSYNSAAEFGPVTIGRASIVNASSGAAANVLVNEVVPLNLLINQSDPTSYSFPRTLAQEAREGNVTLKDATLLSNPIYEQNLNYASASFKTLSISNPRDNHNGIIWQDGFREYHAFLRPDSLTLYTNPNHYSPRINFSLAQIEVAPAVHNIGEWDTLQVVYEDDIIHLLFNGKDVIQFRATPPKA